MEREANASSAVLVPGAHRVIRVLDTDEGPFRGTLVTSGADMAVSTDAALLAGWDGWAFAGLEHLAGPVDIVRREDGHDVLLPWCTERLETYLGRRASSGAPLSGGEISTIVGSLLRGVGEHGDSGVETTRGAWWLTDTGRPVFAIGGGDDLREATGRLVDAVRGLCEDRALRRILDDIASGLEAGRLRPRPSYDELARGESALFAFAAPRALAETAPASAAPSTPARRAGVPRADADRSRTERMTGRLALRRHARASTSRTALIPRVRHAVAMRVRVLSDRILARRDDRTAMSARSTAQDGVPVPRRRRRLVLAGSAAAAVLVIGLAWPTDPPSDADAAVAAQGEQSTGTRRTDGQREEVSPEPEPSAAVEPAQGGDEDSTPPPSSTPGPTGPAETAIALLDDVTACLEAEDRVCAHAVAGGSVDVVGSLVALATAGTSPEAALIDEYGDVAVVRLSAVGDSHDGSAVASDRMMVLIRVDEKWLIRDVYDVADQPG